MSFPGQGRLLGLRAPAVRLQEAPQLDVDALFCRLGLTAEFAASVPRVSPNMALLAYAAAVTPSMGVADIWAWFPAPRDLARWPVGHIASARQALEALQAKEAPCPKT